MKIVLVRHGETTANVARLFCGHTDVLLTEKGIQQAEAAAEKLKDYKFTKMISSDLRRARKTASIINHYHQLPIDRERGLREMNFGECEGYTYEELTKLKPESFKGDRVGKWNFIFPGGESLEVMSSRIRACIDRIRQEADEEDTILIVAHAGVIRMVLALEIARSNESYWRFDIDNCGITELRYHKEFCMMTKLNG
ncbi:MAG: alpha-ribazole phosphatase [Clostridia bacterium]|nr:alpha-ribazole phosphatase [Clostridia bacterium]